MVPWLPFNPVKEHSGIGCCACCCFPKPALPGRCCMPPNSTLHVHCIRMNVCYTTMCPAGYLGSIGVVGSAGCTTSIHYCTVQMKAGHTVYPKPAENSEQTAWVVRSDCNLGRKLTVAFTGGACWERLPWWQARSCRTGWAHAACKSNKLRLQSSSESCAQQA
jgi:hypothetical protein